MNDYTRGAVLGAATTLPATSALGLVLLGRGNTLVVAGFLVLSLISLAITTGGITRFIANRKL